MSLKETGPGLGKIAERLDRLAKMHLLVGIPADRESRSGEPINNAALGYVHEVGKPKLGIPARPFLRPGLRKAKDAMHPHLGQALHDALHGDDPRPGMERAGMIAVSSVRNRFVRNDWPPIQEASIASRLRRRGMTGKSLKRALDKYPRPPKPLVDTGQLRNSITYVIEE